MHDGMLLAQCLKAWHTSDSMVYGFENSKQAENFFNQVSTK